MNWKDKTLTLEQIAQMLREERMTESDIGYPGEFNNGIDMIMFRFGSSLSDANAESEFYKEASGE